MKAVYLLLPVAVTAYTAVAQDVATAGAKAAISAELADMQTALSEITGLKFQKQVPYAVIDKVQLEKYLRERMKDAVKPAEIHAEETTLKMFGFIPADFDLKKATIELLTEQAAAFYDYHKKKLFILETGASTADLHTEAEKMALSHELAHALADQHFHLDKYIREGARSDDGSTARLAVMEGQASWLMTAYLSKLSTGQAAIPPGVLELMTHAVQNSASQYPVFAKAPLYLRESLVFPYTSGMLFQNTIYEKLGPEGFAAVFRRAPESTQQILHPEKYLDRVSPAVPPLPELPDAPRFRRIGDGTLGEFDFRVLVQQYVGEEDARSLSPHATGGMYALFEGRKDRHPVLVWAATWDGPETAQKFFAAYRKILRSKSKDCTFEREDDAELLGRNEYGSFRVRLDNRRFESIEGLPPQVH